MSSLTRLDTDTDTASAETAEAITKLPYYLEPSYLFVYSTEAFNYDDLLSDGCVSCADVRSSGGYSGLHEIPLLGVKHEGNIDTDTLMSYLLTCYPPGEVNGRCTWNANTPLHLAASCKNIIAVKLLIEFGGDRTLKSNHNSYPLPFETPLDSAKEKNHPLDSAKEENQPEVIKLLTVYFPSEE